MFKTLISTQNMVEGMSWPLSMRFGADFNEERLGQWHWRLFDCDPERTYCIPFNFLDGKLVLSVLKYYSPNALACQGQ